MSQYIVSDNGNDRPMTAAEAETYEAAAAALIAQQEQIEAAKAAAVEARKEPLRRLGLTEDEINTVLGL